MQERCKSSGERAEAVAVSDHGAGEESALLATLAVLTHSVCSLRCAHSAYRTRPAILVPWCVLVRHHSAAQ